MSLDWLIIGGGVHGVHVAARLMGEAEVSAEAIRILDPGEDLLARWRACTSATGMTHLRSPSVHHLDLDPRSLQRHAGPRRRRKTGCFAPPYDRPSLDLFDSHCEKVLRRFGLRDLHIRDRAESCVAGCDSVVVTTSSGSRLQAANVVLACGSGDRPRWPQWASRDSARVGHIFDRDDALDDITVGARVVVVGGGISAGQVALRLAKAGHPVHIVSRHPMREHQFDSDPGWLGPKYMAAFQRETDMGRRRAMITDARHRGSVPPDLRRGLRAAQRRGEVTWHEAEVHSAEDTAEGMTLTLSDGSALDADHVVLATGFVGSRPGGRLVDELVQAQSLPCAECGYPIVDASLRWHPRIFVTGPLAELELGPSSRNIAGARRAGDRLVAACQALTSARAPEGC